MVFTLMNSMDATPVGIRQGLYAVGYNYRAMPTFSTHPYQPMPSYIPSPIIQAASYGTPIMQTAASYGTYGTPIMQTAATYGTYGTPMIQASSFGTPMVQVTPYGSHMIQTAPIVQNAQYGTPAISEGSTTKYIAVPKYLRIPLSKYVDPWKVGRGIYLPKYHHSVARS